MTRLIDADKYNELLQRAVYNVQMMDDTFTADSIMQGIRQAQRILKEHPTVDAIPVIRCKDCKHCLNYCRIIEDRKYDYACALKEECGYPYGRFRVNENDFCSRAERKEK